MGLTSQPCSFWHGLWSPEVGKHSLARAGLSQVARGFWQSSTLRTPGHGGPAQKMGLDLPTI